MALAPTPDADILILGGGCAGLSLACALAEAGVNQSVRVLEPRTGYVRDRTWCFWDTEHHLFMDLVSAAWSQWRVSATNATALCTSKRYRYCHIDSADFYQRAQSIIRTTARFSLSLSVRATGTLPHPSGLIQVDTDQGPLLARQVFDSRPPVRESIHPLLVQRFCGWHVNSPTPCFDPSTVELMHFMPAPANDRIRFIYLLPFSPHEALVEWTQFDSPGQCRDENDADMERHLADWLDRHVPGWSVSYRERGALPMGGGSIRRQDDGTVHPIGLRAGCLKASSGYAFARIQRHSRAIARAVAGGDRVPAWSEPALPAWMDAVFLAALKRHPAQAPAWFCRLFGGAPTDSVVRFLSDTASVREMLAVGSTLPKWPMMKAALRASRGAR